MNDITNTINPLLLSSENIQNQDTLIEIATLAFQKSNKNALRLIQNCDIEDTEALRKLLLSCEYSKG